MSIMRDLVISMVILALVIILWMKMHQSGTLKEMPQRRQLIFRMFTVLAALILCVILVFVVLVVLIVIGIVTGDISPA